MIRYTFSKSLKCQIVDNNVVIPITLEIVSVIADCLNAPIAIYAKAASYCCFPVSVAQDTEHQRKDSSPYIYDHRCKQCKIQVTEPQIQSS